MRGVTGNINDAMAAGVEDAVVICPFMTPAYHASRSCKKELNSADTREVIIVPVMLTNNWEASELLGLITAGLLRVNSEEDGPHFDMCLRSLEEEIMYNAGHLLMAEEPPKEVEEQPEPRKARLKKKPGHSLSKLYMQDSGEQIIQTAAESRATVELSESCGDQCHWEEIRGGGCKYYRNVFTHRYLGEEWLLLVDQLDQSYWTAIIIKNKHSGRFLAAQNGSFIGLTSYNEDCKWFLE